MHHGGVSTTIDKTRPTALPLLNPLHVQSNTMQLSTFPCFSAGPFLSQCFSGVQWHYVLLYTYRPPGSCEKELLNHYCNYSDVRLLPTCQGTELSLLYFSIRLLIDLFCKVWNKRKLKNYMVWWINVWLEKKGKYFTNSIHLSLFKRDI